MGVALRAKESTHTHTQARDETNCNCVRTRKCVLNAYCRLITHTKWHTEKGEGAWQDSILRASRALNLN